MRSSSADGTWACGTPRRRPTRCCAKASRSSPRIPAAGEAARSFSTPRTARCGSGRSEDGMDFDLRALLETFAAESDALLDSLEQGLLAIEETRADADTIHRIF